jgi:hypothetical protein
MAVRKITPDLAYGVGDALIPLAPLPIVARRDPSVSDQAQLGTSWVNEKTGAAWILSRIVSNASDWVTSPILGGSGTFTDLTTTGAGGLTVSGLGGINVGAGAFTVDDAGNVVVGGNLSVAGTFTFTGTLDLTSAAEIIISSTFNGSPSIFIEANGGANEQILLQSVQGTTATSIDILSGLGGVVVSGGLNNSSAVHLIASNGAGGVTTSSGTGGITLASANGAIALTSGTGAINIGADAVSHVITIGNTTGATDVIVNAGSGGFSVLTTNSTLALSSGTGIINISADGAATTVNIATANAAKTLTLGSTNAGSATTLRSGAAGLSILSGTGAMAISSDAAATVVGIANGAGSKIATFGSTNTSSTTLIQGGTGGVSISAPFLALPGPVYIYTGAGAPSGALALHVGDTYYNTTAATATTRMYICSVIGTWVNVTCSA